MSEFFSKNEQKFKPKTGVNYKTDARIRLFQKQDFRLLACKYGETLFLAIRGTVGFISLRCVQIIVKSYENKQFQKA